MGAFKISDIKKLLWGSNSLLIYSVCSEVTSTSDVVFCDFKVYEMFFALISAVYLLPVLYLF